MIKKTTEETGYLVGQEYVNRKEFALEKAISFYFKGEPWDESVLAERGVMNVYPDGTEVFVLDHVELVKFGITTTKVTIEGNNVTVLVNQPITELYLS